MGLTNKTEKKDIQKGPLGYRYTEEDKKRILKARRETIKWNETMWKFKTEYNL
jgi:hypothetical protein